MNNATDDLAPAVVAEILAEFRALSTASAAFNEQARQLLPGGETRAVSSYLPYPVVIVEGHGAHLCDVDGRTYIDVVNNYTSLVHGNAFPPVSESVRELLDRGVAFPSPHPHQLGLAQSIRDRLASVQRVRFTNSGTEASLLALRIAQRATRRSTMLVFEGAYHGSATALTPGTQDVVATPWNEVEPALEALRTNDVALVLAEPFLGAGGVRPAIPGFLAAVAQAARECGTLFALDEVQSLRNDVNGAQAALALTPDLTVLGKIIGGGYPLGAVGGSASLLGLTVAAQTHDHVAHAGTFNGHLAAAVAGTVTLDHLDRAAIERLNEAAAALAARVSRAGDSSGVHTTVTRCGSILNVHVRGHARTAALHLALLIEGVYAAPRGMLNLSTALTTGDLDQVGSSYERALRRLNPDR